MDVTQRMTRARTRLLLDHPWFGALSMRLQMVSDETKQTLATDGSKLFYNPAYVAKLTDAELECIMAEETMHCALLHPYRRGARNPERWNKACDYAIYSELQAAGFTIPKDSLIDPKYQGLSADVVYSQLGQDEDPQQQPQGGGTGEVLDAPKEGQGAQGQGQGKPDKSGPGQPGQGQQGPATGQGQGMTAEDWKIAAEQATAVSKAAGNVPGGAVRATKKARESAEDWRATLREFVEHQTPSDYTWGSPNRRHIAEGLYLPGVLKENLGTLAVAVDTSGSISQAVLDCFAAELTAILHEARPERVEVLYCDYEVQHAEEFTPEDEAITLKAHGGGGTRFNPVFARLNAADEQPICCIYFTDLENGREVVTEPAYPVLWCTGLNVTRSAPFGRTVRVDLFS